MLCVGVILRDKTVTSSSLNAEPRVVMIHTSWMRNDIQRFITVNHDYANIMPLRDALDNLMDRIDEENSQIKNSLILPKKAAQAKIKDIADTLCAAYYLLDTLKEAKPEWMTDGEFNLKQTRAIKKFSTITQRTSLGSKILKAIGMVCFAAIGFVVGAAIGMGIGIAAGAWTGPGAFITGAIGAASGAVIGAAAATSVVTGVASGLFMFKAPFGMRHDARSVASAAQHFVDEKKDQIQQVSRLRSGV